MTESKTLLKNWVHKDIKLKDLFDLGFRIPVYTLSYTKNYSVKDFNVSGL